MPAVVSSTDGSCSAGTSEPEGRRLWSRLSKKLRKRSRISSDVTRLSLGCRARCESPRPESSTRTAGCASTRTSPSSRTARRASTAGSRSRRRRSIVPLDDDHVWLVAAVPPPGRRALLGVPAGLVGGRRAGVRRRRSRAASWPRRPACGPARWSRSAGCTSPTGSPTSRSTSGARRTSTEGERALEHTEQGLIARRFARRRGRADDRAPTRSATPPPSPRGTWPRADVHPQAAPLAAAHLVLDPADALVLRVVGLLVHAHLLRPDGGRLDGSRAPPGRAGAAPRRATRTACPGRP